MRSSPWGSAYHRRPMARLLHLVGYPLALAVIARWLAVVREQRWRWFAAHQAAVSAIVAGWLLRGHPLGAALNGAWLAVASAWYGLGARQGRSRRG